MKVNAPIKVIPLRSPSGNLNNRLLESVLVGISLSQPETSKVSDANRQIFFEATPYERVSFCRMGWLSPRCQKSDLARS